MKRGKLIFNINAGSARASMLDNILEKIQRAGYAASYEETKSVEALKSIIQQPYDVLFVAGGDGTLREVARCLLTQPASSRPPIIKTSRGNNS